VRFLLGLINYIDTKAKHRHLNKLACKGGTLRQVFVYQCDGGYGVLGIRQINTCRKVPLHMSIFLDDDILHGIPALLFKWWQGDFSIQMTSSHALAKYRARIFKFLRGPRIDSKEPVPLGCVAWRDGTATLFLLGS